VASPRVAVAVIVVVPNPTGRLAVQLPELSAVVLTTATDSSSSGSHPSTSTVAPGVVVPLTAVVVEVVVEPGVGEVMVSGSVPGMPWVT
jgi:hypothetical protein